MIIKLSKKILGWVLFVSASVFFVLTLNASAIVVKEKFGDWAIHCEGSEGDAAKRCAYVSFVQDKNNPNLKLSIIFVKAKNKGVIFRVLSPLGIFLPPGILIKIDGKKYTNLPFSTCTANVINERLVSSCIMEASVNEKFVSGFKKGGTVEFVVAISTKQGVVLPVSLKSFTKGYDTLKPSLAPKIPTKVKKKKTTSTPDRK